MSEFKMKTEAEWLEIVRETMIERDEIIKELVSLNLWSARRLHKVHKEFAYNHLDKITGGTHERL